MPDKNASTQEAIALEVAIGVNARPKGQENAEPAAESADVAAKSARPGAGTNLRLVYSGEPARKEAKTHAMRSQREASSRPGAIDRFLLAQLGRQLRAIYRDVADEPVPKRFVKLLEDLAAAEDGAKHDIVSDADIDGDTEPADPEKETKS